MRKRVLLLVVLLLGALLPGASSARPVQPGGPLSVFAAASLTEVFPVIDKRPKYQFAGSDQLAFQIQQGAPADVYAAASPKYPEQLYQQGLVQKPIQFATNTLVLIVPKGNPAGIHLVIDLTKPGVKLVIGDAGVPVGAYTRTVLTNLGISAAVMKNVVSQETDVKGVLAKVALGQADAGFVYVTDAKFVLGKIGVIRIRRVSAATRHLRGRRGQELAASCSGIRVRDEADPSAGTAHVGQVRLRPAPQAQTGGLERHD